MFDIASPVHWIYIAGPNKKSTLVAVFNGLPRAGYLGKLNINKINTFDFGKEKFWFEKKRTLLPAIHK